MTLLTSIALASLILAVFIFIFFIFWHPRPRGPEFYTPETKPPRRLKKKRPDLSDLKVAEGVRGEPHTCPVCAAKFEHGETVRSSMLPPTERNDRLLHISGCIYCLSGGRKRECPVCGAEIGTDEYLSARIFERQGKAKKTHVHIIGCNHCRLGGR